MSSFLPLFYFHGPSFIRIDIISSEDITVIASPMARGLMAHFSASKKQDRAIKLTRLGNFWPIADRKLRFPPIGEQKPLAAILETTGRVGASGARNYFRGGARASGTFRPRCPRNRARSPFPVSLSEISAREHSLAHGKRGKKGKEWEKNVPWPPRRGNGERGKLILW